MKKQASKAKFDWRWIFKTHDGQQLVFKTENEARAKAQEIVSHLPYKLEYKVYRVWKQVY